MQIRLATALCAVAPLTAPVTAHAVDYQTADQAARAMFPQADRFETHPLLLDAATQQQLAAQGLRARGPNWQAQVAMKGATALGFVVVDEVIGKFELITYAVGVGLDGAVTQVEILSYRESHGQEVRLPAWRRQFVGKRNGAALRVGDDIANISGATLSCSHVTDGIRRVLWLLDHARRSGALTP
jgi:Na+-translocating ferredoxin:NAD+ oxidoreductase RnfG subunit